MVTWYDVFNVDKAIQCRRKSCDRFTTPINSEKRFFSELIFDHTMPDIKQPIFDALAFEEQRYQIFKQTESQPVLSESYLDGNWDAVIGCEPSSSWGFDSEYRQGYLEGIAKKYDEKYG